MRLPDLIKTIVGSGQSDWWVLPCWGAGSGPTYRDQFIFHSQYDGQPNVMTVESHSNTATLIENASTTMTWGLESGRYSHTWLSKFEHADDATLDYVDVFYNGALVYRTKYVSVDEGRVYLPVPLGERLEVPTGYRSFVRLVHTLTIGSPEEFDSYYRRAGFTTGETSWPSYSER